MRGNARTSRIAAYVASGALVLSGVTLAGTPAEAASYDPIGLHQGTAWLKSQLSDGVVHNDQYDFDDLGLTADVAFALDAVGGQDATVDDIVATMEPVARAAWYTSTFEGTTTTYTGSLAKLLVLVQTAGGDPESYGGENLVTTLESHVQDSGTTAGRGENENDSFGDLNSIGQAYIAGGLDAAGSSEAAAATDYLLEQQCSSGAFRLTLTTERDAVDQSCADGDAPDTDATAIAVLQLAAQSADLAVATAIDKAKTWLVAQQQADGSWGGGTSTQGSNANSTGLAASALGDTTDSAQAAQWLRAHQATDYDACDKLAGHRGAVAYDNAGLAAGRADGISVSTADQWRRASAQAVPALAYLPQDTTPSAPVITGPGGYLEAGTRQILVTSDVAAGDLLCLTGVGAAVQGIATTTRWQKAVVLPRGTSTRVYTVRDSFGHADSVALKVLGRANLTIAKSKNRVKRSRFVTATIRGLAPREWSRIRYKGRLVRNGFSTSNGTFSATFRVGRAKGKKRIVGYGLFTDTRRGATTIRVVR